MCAVQLVGMEFDCVEAQKNISTLRLRLADVEDELQVKEHDFHAMLEEARQTEYRLNDERRRLERSLDEAGTKLIEMKLRLSAAEGSVSALQSQLTHVDLCRVEAETKLASIVSSLRRFLDIGGAVMRSASVDPLHSRYHTTPRSRLSRKGHLRSLLIYS